MRVICAWCADGQRAAESEAAVARSHGLCAPCLSTRLDALRAIAAPDDRAPRARIANAAEQDAA